MLVSVIIPMYNRENTIKDAAMSVLNQTHKELELIVVDDCSKDNSVAVVEELARQDSRVRLIRSDKNGGACVARNIGIDNAKGEIIAFQDSDDIWHDDKLAKCLKAIKEQDADFVFSALRRIGDSGLKNEEDILPRYNMNEEKNPLEKILYLNCVSTQTIAAKSCVFDKVRFDNDMPRFQDWDLSIRVIKEGFKIYYIDEPLVDSYVLGDSITANPKKAYLATKLMEEKYKEDLEEYPVAYHGFYERAAYKYEEAGENGAGCFLKAYKSGKTVSLLLQYILAKLRLYKGFSKVKAKLTGK